MYVIGVMFGYYKCNNNNSQLQNGAKHNDSVNGWNNVTHWIGEQAQQLADLSFSYSFDTNEWASVLAIQ